MQSSGRVICLLNASNVFNGIHEPGLRGLPSRLQSLEKLNLQVAHTIGVSTFFDPFTWFLPQNVQMNLHNTDVSLTGSIDSVPGSEHYGQIAGTVRHQFSPRLALEVRLTSLLSVKQHLNK